MLCDIVCYVALCYVMWYVMLWVIVFLPWQASVMFNYMSHFNYCCT